MRAVLVALAMVAALGVDTRGQTCTTGTCGVRVAAVAAPAPAALPAPAAPVAVAPRYVAAAPPVAWYAPRRVVIYRYPAYVYRTCPNGRCPNR